MGFEPGNWSENFFTTSAVVLLLLPINSCVCGLFIEGTDTFMLDSRYNDSFKFSKSKLESIKIQKHLEDTKIKMAMEDKGFHLTRQFN